LKTKRLFIGIPIVDVPMLWHGYQANKKLLKHYSVRWTEPANWHITLLFMGNTTLEAIDLVRTQLGEIALRHGAFSLQLKGWGAFPSARRPHILWVGSEPCESLMLLQEDVSGMMKNCGFEVADEKFVAHLTLGRMPRDNREALPESFIQDNSETRFDVIKVGSFSLFESQLTPQGAVYKVVCYFPLLGV
jgi:2'-5' RNA ligase